MGQFGLRIDAEQLVHAADQVAGINRPLLDLFALGIRGPDDVPALVEMGARASSMKANPIALEPAEMEEILHRSL